MRRVNYILTIILIFIGQTLNAQKYALSGKVIDVESEKPIEYATILLSENGLWAISNEKGIFFIKDINVSVFRNARCISK